MTGFAAQISGFTEGVRIVLVSEPPDNLYKGAIGPYGKIKGALAYAAFIGDMTDPHVQEKVGYLGEGFILEATANGLGTCWVGGTFNVKVTEQQIGLDAKEKVLAVTPVGYAGKDYGLGEKLVKLIAKSSKRENIDLCNNFRREEWPDWVKTALEAARIAPSAVNRQPWRFTVEKDSITVLVNSPQNSLHISKRLDCGIAMLHLEVGALVKGVQGAWDYLSSPVVARFSI